MDDLIKILHEGHHSLVVANGEVCTFDGRGISDLYNLLNEDPGFLQGAEIADKVVGKGAAALMIIGGIASLYADIISAPALDLLRQSPVKVDFGKQVDNIINRKGDGICPIETLCLPCATAKECLPLITQFIRSIKN
ncbi:MAG: DUF1893 domain-containing protein [Alistipes timonensis]|nr:DUF1893 domain-containing protein [Alistipes timonensis]